MLASSSTENELKTDVLRFARQNGWIVYHVPQRAIRSAGDHGFPDLVCARDGEVIFIELKTERAIQSSAQYTWQLALPAYHVIRPSDWHRVLELLG